MGKKNTCFEANPIFLARIACFAVVRLSMLLDSYEARRYRTTLSKKLLAELEDLLFFFVVFVGATVTSRGRKCQIVAYGSRMLQDALHDGSRKN